MCSMPRTSCASYCVLIPSLVWCINVQSCKHGIPRPSPPQRQCHLRYRHCTWFIQLPICWRIEGLAHSWRICRHRNHGPHVVLQFRLCWASCSFRCTHQKAGENTPTNSYHCSIPGNDVTGLLITEISCIEGSDGVWLAQSCKSYRCRRRAGTLEST
jgi:hypothetical protein